MPEFLIGSLLYAAFNGWSWTLLSKRDAILAGLVAVLIVLLHHGASDFLVILLFPLLILAAVANEGRAAALLNITPLVWLGEISYSLYLCHGLVQFVTTQLLAAAGHDSRDDLSPATSLAIMSLMLLASFLCASYTHHGVEKAGRQRLRLLFGA